LRLCKNSIVFLCLRIFGDFNEPTRSHLRACPSHKELIILQIYKIFISTFQRAVALWGILANHRALFCWRMNICY
jgi:hypothetical protein